MRLFVQQLAGREKSLPRRQPSPTVLTVPTPIQAPFILLLMAFTISALLEKDSDQMSHNLLSKLFNRSEDTELQEEEDDQTDSSLLQGISSMFLSILVLSNI